MNMTGIDIVSIERVRKACCRPGILERLFTKNELAYAFSRRDPFKRLAGRFAAKEAFKGARHGTLKRHKVEGRGDRKKTLLEGL